MEMGGDPSDDDDEEEEEMGGGGRMRDLLASYYGAESFASDKAKGLENDTRVAVVQQLPTTTHYSIDSQSFESTQYVRHLLKTATLRKLLRANEELIFEVKSLDSDMQMLVYENYNKFIAATDTIREMKHDVDLMEVEMDALVANMDSIATKSCVVNESLAGKRHKIDKLVRVRRLLKRLELIFELPSRLSKWLDEGTAGSYTKAVNSYSLFLGVLQKYSHVASFRDIRSECADTMARLRDDMLARLDSLSGAPSLLSSGARRERKLGGVLFGVTPVAQDTTKDGSEGVVDGFDSPSEVVCYAALLLKLDLPAAAIRQVVLSFGRSYFLEILAETGKGSKDVMFPLGRSIDSEMRVLSNSFLPCLIVFLRRCRLLLVDAMSITNEMPGNAETSKSDATLGVELKTAAVELVSLVEELGFAYLASTSLLLDRFGDAKSFEGEMEIAKVQGTTPVRFRSVVEALQQIIEAVGSLEEVVEPMRGILSASVATSAPLSPTDNSGLFGIREKASEIVEYTVRNEIDRAFAWLRNNSMRNLAALYRSVGNEAREFKEEWIAHFGGTGDAALQDDRHSEQAEDTDKPTAYSEASGARAPNVAGKGRYTKLPDIASSMFCALETVLRCMQSLVSVCSSILNETEERSYIGVVSDNIWLSVAWLTDAIESLCGVTQRFDPIAVVAMHHLGCGVVSREMDTVGTASDCVVHGLDIPTTFDWHRFVDCDEKPCGESLKSDDVLRVNWLRRGEIRETDSTSQGSPRFVLVAACVCQDIQVSLIPNITSLVRRFASGDEKGSGSRATRCTEGVFNDYGGSGAKGSIKHHNSGRLTENELRAHILAAANRLVSHFAETHGSNLGSQMKGALVAEEMINGNDSRCRVRPSFLSAGGAIKYVALETAFVLQVVPASADAICKFKGGSPSLQSLQLHRREPEKEEMKRSLAAVEARAERSGLNMSGRTLELDINRVFDATMNGKKEGVDFSVESILLASVQYFFAGVLEGIRGRTCLSNHNRQIQIDMQFLRYLVHYMIDDVLEVDGLVEDVLVSNIWCSTERYRWEDINEMASSVRSGISALQ